MELSVQKDQLPRCAMCVVTQGPTLRKPFDQEEMATHSTPVGLPEKPHGLKDLVGSTVHGVTKDQT